MCRRRLSTTAAVVSAAAAGAYTGMSQTSSGYSGAMSASTQFGFLFDGGGFVRHQHVFVGGQRFERSRASGGGGGHK